MEEKDEVERKIKSVKSVYSKILPTCFIQREGTENSPKQILKQPNHTKHILKRTLSPSPLAQCMWFSSGNVKTLCCCRNSYNKEDLENFLKDKGFFLLYRSGLPHQRSAPFTSGGNIMCVLPQSKPVLTFVTLFTS